MSFHIPEAPAKLLRHAGVLTQGRVFPTAHVSRRGNRPAGSVMTVLHDPVPIADKESGFLCNLEGRTRTGRSGGRRQSTFVLNSAFASLCPRTTCAETDWPWIPWRGHALAIVRGSQFPPHTDTL